MSFFSSLFSYSLLLKQCDTFQALARHVIQMNETGMASWINAWETNPGACFGFIQYGHLTDRRLCLTWGGGCYTLEILDFTIIFCLPSLEVSILLKFEIQTAKLIAELAKLL